MNQFALLLGILFVASAHAQDAQRGALLYQTYCGGCHYERVHDRLPERSIVKSRSTLQDQVERWAPEVKRAFSKDEITDIVEYLDRTHYKLTR